MQHYIVPILIAAQFITSLQVGLAIDIDNEYHHNSHKFHHETSLPAIRSRAHVHELGQNGMERSTWLVSPTFEAVPARRTSSLNTQVTRQDQSSLTNEMRYQQPSSRSLMSWQRPLSPPERGRESSAALERHSMILDQVDSPQSNKLELALSQAANGDESLFQPSPIIVAPGHASSLDWSTQRPSGGVIEQDSPAPTRNQQSLSNGGHATKELKESALIESSAGSTTSTLAPTTSSAPMAILTTEAATTSASGHSGSSTELSNQLEPLVLLHGHSVLSNQREFSTTNGNQSAPVLEINNQIIYEGPATAPSATNSDEYYFSSSSSADKIKEKGLTGNGSDKRPASNAWWALGVGDEFELINNLTRDNYLEYCDGTPLLVNSKQRSLCRMHPRVMAVVARGVKMAIDECQTKFATSRWNCSLIVLDTLFRHRITNGTGTDDQSAQLISNQSIFGNFMDRPNRERSFLNAIIAAGLAHSMTKACSQGELPEECSCDRRIKSKTHKGRVEWVACSDDIDYGARFSRDFTDNFDPLESDATTTIYMHNNEVGRRVFKSATDITCTCLNNDNGMCQTKRCWRHLGSFSDIIDELIKRYEGATHVQPSNRDPHKLRPVRRGVRKPKRKDLVYIEESPDYCQRDTRIGVLGTQNRVCNSTSQGTDSCSLLCCGRGFQTVLEHIEEECNCKFVWCCQVKCQKCKRQVANDVCN